MYLGLLNFGNPPESGFRPTLDTDSRYGLKICTPDLDQICLCRGLHSPSALATNIIIQNALLLKKFWRNLTTSVT